jgi:hypothetical protein
MYLYVFSKISEHNKQIPSRFTMNPSIHTLPIDTVHHILSYDSRFVIHNGKIIQINKIPQDDYRRTLLLTIQVPKKRHFILRWKSVNLVINENKKYTILKCDNTYNYHVYLCKQLHIYDSWICR